MKISEKKRAAAMLVIQVPGEECIITMSLRRNRESVRGQQDYRRALKAVITECEQRLGPYRRRK